MRYPSSWQLKESKIKQTFKVPFVPEVYATEPLNFYSILTSIFNVEFTDPQNKTIRDLRGVPASIVISINHLKDGSTLQDIYDIDSYG